jgi:hypothetical protein
MRRAAVRSWLVLAVLIGTTVVLAMSLGVYTYFSLARPRLVQEVHSPLGHVVAREYRYVTDWNFDPAYGREITVASGGFPWRWLLHGHTVLRGQCSSLALAWEGERRLRINGQCDNVRQRDDTWEDVTIDYQLGS